MNTIRKTALIGSFVILGAANAFALEWSELEKEITSTIESLKLSRHSVETKYSEGTLTVTGYVSSAAEKARVVDALSHVKGITTVDSQLEVKNENGGGTTADDPIRKEAIDAVKRLDGLGSYEIDVHSENNELVIDGTAATPRDRTRIAEAVKLVAGSRTVNNHLKVAPPASDSEVEANVWQALRKDPDLDVEGVTVRASAGVVTVGGKRPNHRLIDRILSIVNMADGVQEVKSEMKVNK